MFICYLDDSGKDPQNPSITLAGYVARDTEWHLFEENVRLVFKGFGVEVLHAIDLHETKGDFEGWDWARKQEFISRVCETMIISHVSLGLSVSVVKTNYQARREESRAKGMEMKSPYCYCFNVLWDRLLSDRNSWVSDAISRVRDAIRAEGMSFILERGHENNAEVKQGFQKARQRHKLEGVLGVVSFHAKHDSRAIQLADLFAYYSRRNVTNLAQGKNGMEPILEIICRSIRHHDFLVTDVFD